MKVVIQRVSHCSVTIDAVKVASIKTGVLVLLGIIDKDSKDDIDWLANKIANLRIFPDDNNIMNRSLLDIEGDVVIVSQFTLHAGTKKGNRPSYINAAKPNVAIPLYEKFVEQMATLIGKPVQTGEFGADMKVDLCNDGPVTIIIDTKIKV